MGAGPGLSSNSLAIDRWQLLDSEPCAFVAAPLAPELRLHHQVAPPEPVEPIQRLHRGLQEPEPHVDPRPQRSATATFTVTVDTSPVVYDLPADIATKTDPGLPTSVVTWSEPTATDNTAVASFTSTHSPATASTLQPCP